LKINAFRNNDPKYSADLWKVTTTTDTEGGAVFSYAFDRQITFTAINGGFGKLEIRLDDTCDDVVVLDHLFRLYGPDGQELLEHGVWQIDNIAPYINIWGYREGYKARIQQFGVDG
jgi:hypothetical protein